MCLLNNNFSIFPLGAAVNIGDTYICLYFCCNTYGDVMGIIIISYGLLERCYAFNCSFRASVGHFVYKLCAFGLGCNSVPVNIDTSDEHIQNFKMNKTCACKTSDLKGPSTGNLSKYASPQFQP